MAWDENTPAGSENINNGDNRIRELKVDVRAGLEANDATLGDAGSFPGATPASPIYHYRGLKGTTAQRPAAGDYGLYFNTSTNKLQRDNGTIWEDMDVSNSTDPTFNLATSASPSTDDQYKINYANEFFSESSSGSSTTSTNSVYVEVAETSIWEIGFMDKEFSASTQKNYIKLISDTLTGVAGFGMRGNMNVLVDSTNVQWYPYDFNSGTLLGATWGNKCNKLFPLPSHFYYELSAGTRQIQIELEVPADTGSYKSDTLQFRGSWYARRLPKVPDL